MRRLRPIGPSLACLLPDVNVLGLALLIGLLAVLMPYPPTELLEELLALLALFYSGRLFIRLSRAETSRAAAPRERVSAQP